MATDTLTRDDPRESPTTAYQSNRLPEGSAERFSTTHLNAIGRDLEAARVTLRLVSLALRAEEGGAISHRDNLGASRWSAAISTVLSRLDCVRAALMETTHAPAIDWPTPFALVTALDSALWEGYCTPEPLTVDETQTAIGVVIESIDCLLAECTELASSDSKTSGPGVLQ